MALAHWCFILSILTFWAAVLRTMYDSYDLLIYYRLTRSSWCSRRSSRRTASPVPSSGARWARAAEMRTMYVGGGSQGRHEVPGIGDDVNSGPNQHGMTSTRGNEAPPST